MPEPKVKAETYTLLGGLNIKASKYVTAPTEFLDLQNVNFNRPNALSSRSGLSNYTRADGNPVGQSLAMITGLHEHAEFSGFSIIVVAGMSTMEGYGDFGVTTVSSNTRTLIGQPPLMDMQTFVDHLFYCNGQIMKKFSSGFQEEIFTLPPGPTILDGRAGEPFVTGLTYMGAPSTTGYFQFAYGYLNDRGYLGPAINTIDVSLTPNYGALFYGLTTPANAGITAIAVYMTEPDLTPLFPTPTTFLPAGTTYFFISANYMPLGAGVTLFRQQPITYLPGLVNILPGIVASGATYYSVGNAGLTTPSGISLIGISLSIAIQATFATLGFAYGFITNGGSLGPMSPPTYIGITYSEAVWVQGISIPSGLGIQGYVLATNFGGGSSFFLAGQTYLYNFPTGYSGMWVGGPTPATDIVIPDSNNSLILGLQPAPTALYFTLIPKYMQVYQNSLFLSGISGQASNVYFSDPGEPESIEPTNFFEVRTNDGDRVTGMKAYGAKMVISKRKSMHLLTGSSAENYYLREISTEYGCLSHRALVVFEDTLLFLDEKGIAMFDGQGCKIISNKLEAVFKTMNVGRAIDTAVAVHNRPENQVIFAFPSRGGGAYSPGFGTNGYNDTIVVYDYLVNAWTVYRNIEPSCLMVGKGSFGNDTLFAAIYGSASPVTGTGQTFVPYLQYFSSSLATDLYSFGFNLQPPPGGTVTSLSGVLTGISQLIQGISCSWTSPFHNPFGHSIECQFRRIYSDFDPISGSTVLANIGVFADFGYTPGAANTAYGSTFYTMQLSQFQSRLEIGVPAKAIAVQWNMASMSAPIVFNGYTIEGRVQRLV